MQHTSVVLFHIYALFVIKIVAIDQVANDPLLGSSEENVQLLRLEEIFTAVPYRIESYRRIERDSDITIYLAEFPTVFYKNSTPSYIFECTLSSVIDEAYVLLNVTTQNGSTSVQRQRVSVSTSFSYPFNVTLQVEMASVQCALAVLLPDNIVRLSTKKPVTVVDACAPTDYFIEIVVVIAIAVSLIIVIAAVMGWNYCITAKERSWSTITRCTSVQSELDEGPSEIFIKDFLDGKPDSTTLDRYEAVDGHERAKSLKYDKYIEPSDLHVDWKAEKGRGHFGKVFEGTYGELPVAIKFLPTHTFSHLHSALMEMKVMAYVGDHPNIVKFVGADISPFHRGELYIVMELSLDGSLDSYLRKSQPPDDLTLIPNRKKYKTIRRTLSTQMLLKFCVQVATAMEYLGIKKIIHGDLAARNVLVFPGHVVKLSDFGYARPLYEGTQYEADENLPLPFQWASVELLLHKEFSPASDTWAFGVTLWEIFTFGRWPYVEWHSLDDQFLEKLTAGMRLPKPEFASSEIWDVITSCWKAAAAERPSFTELKVQLQILIDAQNGQQRVSLTREGY